MLYTFDTETRGLFGKIFRWAAYDGQSITRGYTGTEAVVWLMGLSEEDHVYIHNLEFDLSKLLQEGLLVDLDHSKIINRSFAVAEVIGGPTLHCSWHIMRASLDSPDISGSGWCRSPPQPRKTNRPAQRFVAFLKTATALNCPLVLLSKGSWLYSQGV